MDTAGAVELSPAQCLIRLRSSTWGRVAISMKTIAMVIPVPILALDDRMVFATVWGSTFDRAVQEQAISIQAEGLESAPGTGDLLWSVVVSGICVPDTDPGLLSPRADTGEQERARFNSVPFSLMQGWRAPLLPQLLPQLLSPLAPPRPEPATTFGPAGQGR
jgi:hypothetical protein